MRKAWTLLTIVAVFAGGILLGAATDLSPYSKAVITLDEVSTRINQNAQRMESGYSQINTALTDLGAIPTQYSDVITWINTQATNNPGDEAIQDLKRKKDKLASEFNALEVEAQEWKTALDGVRD